MRSDFPGKYHVRATESNDLRCNHVPRPKQGTVAVSYSLAMPIDQISQHGFLDMTEHMQSCLFSKSVLAFCYKRRKESTNAASIKYQVEAHVELRLDGFSIQSNIQLCMCKDFVSKARQVIHCVCWPERKNGYDSGKVLEAFYMIINHMLTRDDVHEEAVHELHQ